MSKAYPIRTKELLFVDSSEITVNEKNPWRHTLDQRKALEAILNEVGFAGAVLCRRDEEGRLVLIDGELRTEHCAQVPVLVLDVTEEEADKLLAVYNQVAKLVGTDQKAMAALMESLKFDEAHLAEMVEKMSGVHVPLKEKPKYEIVQQFNESYHYLIVFARNTTEMLWLEQRLKLEQMGSYKNSAVGVGRVLTVPQFKERLDGDPGTGEGGDRVDGSGGAGDDAPGDSAQHRVCAGEPDGSVRETQPGDGVAGAPGQHHGVAGQDSVDLGPVRRDLPDG